MIAVVDPFDFAIGVWLEVRPVRRTLLKKQGGAIAARGGYARSVCVETFECEV